jgi:hypothetical protein
MIKQCSKCKRFGIPIDPSKPREVYHCRECANMYVEKSRGKNADTKKAIVQALKAKPCTDCGNQYPIECMDFDHVQPVLKAGTISRMVKDASSVKKFIKELDKCEVVCSNCHRIRTRVRQEVVREATLEAYQLPKVASNSDLVKAIAVTGLDISGKPKSELAMARELAMALNISVRTAQRRLRKARETKELGVT